MTGVFLRSATIVMLCLSPAVKLHKYAHANQAVYAFETKSFLSFFGKQGRAEGLKISCWQPTSHDFKFAIPCLLS